MSKNEKEKSDVVVCSHCGRPLAEMRGASSVEARCPDCWRTTRYYDHRMIEKKSQDVVLDR
jgi:LSD1 subclass zinc finger protein